MEYNFMLNGIHEITMKFTAVTLLLASKTVPMKTQSNWLSYINCKNIEFVHNVRDTYSIVRMVLQYHACKITMHVK